MHLSMKGGLLHDKEADPSSEISKQLGTTILELQAINTDLNGKFKAR